MENKSAVGGNSYTEKHKHGTDTARTRHNSTAPSQAPFPEHCPWVSPGDGTGYHETSAPTPYCAPCPGTCRSLTNIHNEIFYISVERLNAYLQIVFMIIIIIIINTDTHTFTLSQSHTIS